jgi:uncharacterized cofD-like protein
MNLNNLAKVVSIGGGTGLACLLKGLKHGVLDLPVIEAPSQPPWISRLTAIVTVADDGGSSGRLRDELQILPPGDIRNCMVALSTDESLLGRLFQYRFSGSGQLNGHSFGNLFVSALTGVTGDFLEAIRMSSDVLAIKGRIYPSTLRDVRLEAILEDGSRAYGESAISGSSLRIERVNLVPADCRPVRAVLEAIRSADVITVGPGSLFTSIVPNLLVRGIAREIRKSPAVKIYVGNLMTQPGETTGFSAAEHVEVIYSHCGQRLFDGIVLNNAPIPRAEAARYRLLGSTPVISDHARLQDLGLEIYEERMLAPGKVIRHDPLRLTEAIHGAYRMWRVSSDGGKVRQISASV